MDAQVYTKTLMKGFREAQEGLPGLQKRDFLDGPCFYARKGGLAHFKPEGFWRVLGSLNRLVVGVFYLTNSVCQRMLQFQSHSNDVCTPGEDENWVFA